MLCDVVAVAHADAKSDALADGEPLKLDRALTLAADTLPILDQRTKQNFAGAGRRAEAADFPGALASLAAFVVAACFVFLRRLRPE